MEDSLFTNLIQMLLALAAVCLFAFAVLKWLSQKKGFQQFSNQGGKIKIIERKSLSPKQTLYLIEIEKKQYLIGCGENASPMLIKELPNPEDSNR